MKMPALSQHNEIFIYLEIHTFFEGEFTRTFLVQYSSPYLVCNTSLKHDGC